MNRFRKFCVLYLFTGLVTALWIQVEESYRSIHRLLDVLQWKSGKIICPKDMFGYPPSCWDTAVFSLHMLILFAFIAPFWIHFLLEFSFQKYQNSSIFSFIRWIKLWQRYGFIKGTKRSICNDFEFTCTYIGSGSNPCLLCKTGTVFGNKFCMECNNTIHQIATTTSVICLRQGIPKDIRKIIVQKIIP